MSTLNVKNVNKSYGKVRVLHDISLSMESNSFVVFVGPSGCGKSTLLRTIAGLEDIESGQILLDEQDISTAAPVDRDVAMVFQSYALYPQMTVAQNMGFPLKVARVPRAEIKQKVEEVGEFLQLSSLLDRKPKDLSGGQRQRVAIGRAVVRDPRVFLFDEPLSNLDAELRVEMRFQLARMRQQLSATFVYVTHDQVEAMTLADQIVVLRDGRVEQVGAPLELYHHPNNKFVAGFIGSPKMNFFEGRQSEDKRTFELEDGSSISIAAKSGVHSIGVRTEDIKITATGPVSVTVEMKEHLGNTAYLHTLTPSGQRITIEIDPKDEIEFGSEVALEIDTAQIHYFDHNDLRID